MNREAVEKLRQQYEAQYEDVSGVVYAAMLRLDVVELSGKGLEPCSLAKPGNGKNWVEEEGGLPPYICNVAKEILKSNPSYNTGRAIAAAVSQIKKWIADPKTTAATKAKASAAIADWEKKKASARATPNKK